MLLLHRRGCPAEVGHWKLQQSKSKKLPSSHCSSGLRTPSIVQVSHVADPSKSPSAWSVLATAGQLSRVLAHHRRRVVGVVAASPTPSESVSA
jgi:hypothetical protein